MGGKRKSIIRINKKKKRENKKKKEEKQIQCLDHQFSFTNKLILLQSVTNLSILEKPLLCNKKFYLA